ncbi:uncharacterized protein Tco025E_03699 [Trypanosoma conorhini]|uniref:Uncharacterized protein n=1 Tax=Trypanosoma conorhini TaxID=83891 RepID=A0A422PSD1_9TRYP|nr:uncharacterized protein Tco025E_03699 [Trypanosoma conorhini]RNF20672.1 hypothetical protein Tco025E_03699 [Trypanosoma conorhini]
MNFLCVLAWPSSPAAVEPCCRRLHGAAGPWRRRRPAHAHAPSTLPNTSRSVEERRSGSKGASSIWDARPAGRRCSSWLWRRHCRYAGGRTAALRPTTEGRLSVSLRPAAATAARGVDWQAVGRRRGRPAEVLAALLADCAPPPALAALPLRLFEATVLCDDDPRTAEAGEGRWGRAAAPRPSGLNYGSEASPRATGRSSRIVCPVAQAHRV